MKESLSKKVKLDDALSLKKILSLHQFSRNYSGIIYILENHKRINLNNLPKLVSFLLTCKNHQLKIVIDGPRTRETLSEIQDVINSNLYQKALNASLEISI